MVAYGFGFREEFVDEPAFWFGELLDTVFHCARPDDASEVLDFAYPNRPLVINEEEVNLARDFESEPEGVVLLKIGSVFETKGHSSLCRFSFKGLRFVASVVP